MDLEKENTCGCGHDHHHDDCDCGCEEMATMMLSLEDGSELKCDVMGIFNVEEIADKDYIALVREDNDEVLIYEYSEDESEEPILKNIDSDEEYDKVEAAFMDLLEAEEEETEE